MTGTDSPDEGTEVGRATPSSALPLPDTLAGLDDRRAAEVSFEAVRTVMRPLIDDHPEAFWYRRAYCRATIGLALIHDTDEPQRAKDLLEEAVAVSPDHSGSRRALAHFLTESTAVAMRDFAEAVQQAEAGVEHAPHVWTAWLALGRARHRAGDDQGTLDALARTNLPDDAAPEFLAFVGFLQAQALHRLGHARAADEQFDDAVRAAAQTGPYFRSRLDAAQSEAALVLSRLSAR